MNNRPYKKLFIPRWLLLCSIFFPPLFVVLAVLSQVKLPYTLEDLKNIGKTKPQEKKTAAPAEKAELAPDAAEETETVPASEENNASAQAASEAPAAAEEEGESV